jgi:transposase InsO family protein
MTDFQSALGVPASCLPPGWPEPQHAATPYAGGGNRGAEAAARDPGAGSTLRALGRRLVDRRLRLDWRSVNHKRVQRMWRMRGCSDPATQAEACKVHRWIYGATEGLKPAPRVGDRLPMRQNDGRTHAQVPCTCWMNAAAFAWPFMSAGVAGPLS